MNRSTLSAACLVLLASCSRDPSSSPTSAAPRIELVVAAATSTRDALQALEAQYEREQGIDLVFNFGSSGDLARQIVAAGKADVFLSAGIDEMDLVDRAGLVAAGSRQPLLSNQLVVIVPVDREPVFAGAFTPKQLADPALTRLALANVDTVPAGRYARAWLEKVGVWNDVAERVLPGVDVRATLAAVESGSASAGIVYRTDVAFSKRARIVHEVPLDEGPRILYPIAAIAGRPHEKRSRAFVDWLTCPTPQPAFEERGFVFVAGSIGSCR